MSQPFDGDGPTLKESLKKFREFATSPKATYLRKALEKASELYFNVKQKPNPVGAVSSLLGLVEYGAEVLTPIPQKTKKSMSKAQSAFQKIFDEGWLLLEIETAEVVLPLLDMEKTVLVCRDDEEDPSSYSLWKYEYEEGKFFYWLEWGDSTSVLSLPESQAEDRSKILADIQDLLWNPHGNFIEVDYDESEEKLSFSTKPQVPWHYEGDQGDRLIERWRRFGQAGLRRSVILHGPPGTGKSTLAQQAGREIQGRVCFISVQILSKVTIHTLLEVLETLSPDIFIVDDLDRMGQRDLDFFLGFFEESENHIPLLIATTNHLEHLPDALKRPGRFDEIWAVNPPRGEIRLRVINYLAELEGVTLSEQGAKKLLEVSEKLDLPGAHLRELLRRVAVMGEDELDFDKTDLTFDDNWRNTDPYGSAYKVASPMSNMSKQIDNFKYVVYDDDDMDDMEEWDEVLSLSDLYAGDE